MGAFSVNRNRKLFHCRFSSSSSRYFPPLCSGFYSEKNIRVYLQTLFTQLKLLSRIFSPSFSSLSHLAHLLNKIFRTSCNFIELNFIALTPFSIRIRMRFSSSFHSIHIHKIRDLKRFTSLRFELEIWDFFKLLYNFVFIFSKK